MPDQIQKGLPPRPDGRLWGGLLVLGGLTGLVVALTHPQGNPVEYAGQHEWWTTVHVFGALGFGLIATASLLQLVGGRVLNGAAYLGTAGLVVFGTVAMLAMVVDGFTNPALAAIAEDPAAGAITETLLNLERGIAAFGYGGFGLAAGLAAVALLPEFGSGMRVAGALAILALLAFAGAGVLYIGMGVEPLGVLFALSPLAMAWFVLLGCRALLGRDGAVP